MFWEEINSECSTLNKLLESENFTLDDLLFDDDFIHEFENENMKLIEFLIKPEVMQQLIQYITIEPSPDLDEKIRFKKANVTCGLFTSRQTDIEVALLSNEPLMDQMLSFLQNKPPLHPLLASFFTKAMIACLNKFCALTVAYLEKRPDFFDRLIDHIETSAIMNLLNNILTNPFENVAGGAAWVNSSNIVFKIVNVFKEKDSIESHENAATLLCELINNFQTSFAMEENKKVCILQDIESKTTINALLENIFQKNTASALINGFNVILKLLEKDTELSYIRNVTSILKLVDNSKSYRFLRCPDDKKVKEAEEPIKFFARVCNVHEALMTRLPLMKQLLINPIQEEPIKTTVGIIEKPFGMTRLKIVTVLRTLIVFNNPKMNAKIKELEFFPILIDLFFKYPWNNFLHNQFEQCVDLIFLNVNLSPPQFTLQTDSTESETIQEASTKDVSILDASSNNENAVAQQDSNESTEMEVTPMETTTATEMEITITDPVVLQQHDFHVQTSLLEIIRQMLVDSNLIGRLIASLAETRLQKGQKSRIPQPAYNGHLIKIANCIDGAIKTFEFLKDAIQGMLTKEQLVEWDAFVMDELTKQNEQVSTCLGQVHSEDSYNRSEINTNEALMLYQMEHISKPLCKNMEPNYSCYKLDEGYKHSIDELASLTINYEYCRSEPNEILAEFEKLCNERIKPAIAYSSGDEDETETGEQKGNSDSTKDAKKDGQDSSNLDEATEAGDDSKKEEESSGFASFFQPKASSSNLSTDLKMEIDPFLEIPNSFDNLTSDSFDNAIWTNANSTSNEEVVDSWADFTGFEGKPEAGDQIETIEAKKSNVDNEQVPAIESTLKPTTEMTSDSQVIVVNPENVSSTQSPPEEEKESPLQTK